MRQKNKVIKATLLISVLFGFLAVSSTLAAEKEELLIGSRPVKLRDHKLPERADLCTDCHKKKDKAAFPRKGRPSREHGDISNLHGHLQVSCNNCHDQNNSNLLKGTDEFKADFKNPSPVCGTCHAIIFQEWRRGLHGKRTSGVDGIREQLHCVDCHNNHSVTFKKMEASPAPHKPKFLVEKHEESSTEHSGE